MRLFTTNKESKKDTGIFECSGNHQNAIGFGLAMGICIGCGIGVAMDDIGAGFAIGVGIGVCFGLVFKRQKEKSSEQAED
jgi:hypothetical protein